MNGSDSGALSFGSLTSATLGGLKGSRILTLQNASSAAVTANVGNNNQTTTYTGQIDGSGVFNKLGTGTFFLDGTIIAASVTVSAGKFGGNGTIMAPVTVLSGGTLAPGDSVGRLNMSNSLTLSSGGDVVIEIDKNAGTNDVIAGLTSVTYGGTLSISNLNLALAAGDNFKIFSAGAYSGAFDAIVPAPGLNLIWDASRLTVDGTLKVADATAGSGIHIDRIAVSSPNVLVSGTGGTAGNSYSLLSSPDILAPITNWSLVASNVFDGSGNFSETNGVAGQPRLFFIIRSP